MTAHLSDEARRTIFAEADQLDAMRARIPTLSDAALRICYVDIEREIVRRAANASHAASTAAHAEQPRCASVAATEPTSSETTLLTPTVTSSAPTSTALPTIEATPSEPISSALSAIEPTSSTRSENALAAIEATPNPSAPSTNEPTLSDATSTTPTSTDPTSSDRPSGDPTSIALTTEPTSTSAPTIDLPYAEAKARKEREIAALEREYLARLMAAANGNFSHAARLAGVDRTNFKRRLQRAGLRPHGTLMTVSKTIEHPAKHIDTILEILATNPHGLRTYEVAKEIEQAIGNAHNLLKHLERQGRIERHGERYTTLWTLAGGTPVPRVETIPAAAIAVVSQATGPVDGQRLRDEMIVLLTSANKSPSKAALRRAIGRLVSSGVLACAGANEHGAMYALGQTREESEMN